MRKLLVTAILFAVAVLGMGIVTTAPAHAVSNNTRYSAMRYALAQKSKPYRYGGTGPSSYDCSGLVYKSYRQAGVAIPRTADQQYHWYRSRHIPASQARWGDLVFWVSGGSAYHVEFMTTKANLSFGAHHSGTRISYRGFSGTVHYVHIA